MTTFHDYTFSVYTPILIPSGNGFTTKYRKTTRTVFNHSLQTVIGYTLYGHARLGIPAASSDTLLVADELVDVSGNTVVYPENRVVMLFSLNEDGIDPINVSRSANAYISTYDSLTIQHN